jgi:hypothetical protein
VCSCFCGVAQEFLLGFKSKDCYSGRIFLDSCINATAGDMLNPRPPGWLPRRYLAGQCPWALFLCSVWMMNCPKSFRADFAESVPDWMVLGILVSFFPSLRVKTLQKSFHVLHEMAIREINALNFIQTLLPRIIPSLLRGQAPSYTSYRVWLPSWLPHSWDYRYHTVAQSHVSETGQMSLLLCAKAITRHGILKVDLYS